MLNQIKELITNYVMVDADTITEDSLLRTDLAMSSLDIINLAVEIEDNFGIEFPNNDLLQVRTVGDVISYINSKK